MVIPAMKEHYTRVVRSDVVRVRKSLNASRRASNTAVQRDLQLACEEVRHLRSRILRRREIFKPSFGAQRRHTLCDRNRTLQHAVYSRLVEHRFLHDSDGELQSGIDVETCIKPINFESTHRCSHMDFPPSHANAQGRLVGTRTSGHTQSFLDIPSSSNIILGADEVQVCRGVGIVMGLAAYLGTGPSRKPQVCTDSTGCYDILAFSCQRVAQ